METSDMALPRRTRDDTKRLGHWKRVV